MLYDILSIDGVELDMFGFVDTQLDRTDEQAPDDMVSLGEWVNTFEREDYYE